MTSPAGREIPTYDYAHAFDFGQAPLPPVPAIALGSRERLGRGSRSIATLWTTNRDSVKYLSVTPEDVVAAPCPQLVSAAPAAEFIAASSPEKAARQRRSDEVSIRGG